MLTQNRLIYNQVDQCPGVDQLKDFVNNCSQGYHSSLIKEHINNCELCKHTLEGIRAFSLLKNKDETVNVQKRLENDRKTIELMLNKRKAEKLKQLRRQILKNPDKIIFCTYTTDDNIRGVKYSLLVI